MKDISFSCVPPHNRIFIVLKKKPIKICVIHKKDVILHLLKPIHEVLRQSYIRKRHGCLFKQNGTSEIS